MSLTETTAAPAAQTATPAPDAVLSDNEALRLFSELDRDNLTADASPDSEAALFGDDAATVPATAKPEDKPAPVPQEEKKPTPAEAAPVPATAQNPTPAPSTPAPAALDSQTEADIEARCPWSKDDPKVADYRKQWIHQQKDQARLAKGWQEFTKTKESERAELTRLREEAAKERERLEQVQNTYTPEDYEAAADAFAKRGQTDLASQARQAAAAARAGRADQLAQSFQSRKAQELEQARQWEAHALRAVAEVPELNDPNSAATKAARQALTDYGLTALPHGPLVAARLAKQALAHQQATAELATLRDKVAAAEAEASRLRGLMTPPGSQGAAVRLPSPGQPASDAEGEAVMRQLDAAGVGFWN